MDKIVEKLSGFEPTTLAQMDAVKLMNRTDRKFCFHIDTFIDLLDYLNQYYFVLEVEGVRISRYKSLYYDTAGFELYHLHQCGKMNRVKVRHRTYVESKIGFLELKIKNNKGRTDKSRILHNEVITNFEDKAQQFIEKKTLLNVTQLVPKIWVNYSRITFVNKFYPERLTIDLNLEFDNYNTNIKYSNVVIAELKQDKKAHSPMVDLMKKQYIREGSISKYAMGVALCWPTIKQNNFKTKLKSIHQLENGK